MKTDYSQFVRSYDPKSCCIKCHREIFLSELQEDLGILDLLNDIDDPEIDGRSVTCSIEWECVGCTAINKISVTVKGYDELWYDDGFGESFEGFGSVEVDKFEVIY